MPVYRDALGRAMCARPGCMNPLPKRKRVYCSHKCANKVANDKYAAKHPEPDALTRRIALMPGAAQKGYQSILSNDQAAARLVQDVLMSSRSGGVKQAALLIAGYYQAYARIYHDQDPGKAGRYAQSAHEIADYYDVTALPVRPGQGGQTAQSAARPLVR